MEDVPVGEFVTIGNEVYKCVVFVTCSSCDFDSIDTCNSYDCGENQTNPERMFILYDTIPEEY